MGFRLRVYKRYYKGYYKGLGLLYGFRLQGSIRITIRGIVRLL